VKHLLSLVLILLLLLLSSGCGTFFVRGAVRTESIQGSVSFVQLGSLVDGTGATVQVTFVTLIATAAPFTIGFCDDQIDLFPLDQTVLVDFNPGQPCATVIVVSIVV